VSDKVSVWPLPNHGSYVVLPGDLSVARRVDGRLRRVQLHAGDMIVWHRGTAYFVVEGEDLGGVPPR
jgi:hypothetical protein